MKKIFFAALFAIATTFGGYQSYASTSSTELSETAKANIEALNNRVSDGFRCCDDLPYSKFNFLKSGLCERYSLHLKLENRWRFRIIGHLEW